MVPRTLAATGIRSDSDCSDIVVLRASSQCMYGKIICLGGEASRSYISGMNDEEVIETMGMMSRLGENLGMMR